MGKTCLSSPINFYSSWSLDCDSEANAELDGISWLTTSHAVLQLSQVHVCTQTYSKWSNLICFEKKQHSNVSIFNKEHDFTFSKSLEKTNGLHLLTWAPATHDCAQGMSVQ